MVYKEVVPIEVVVPSACLALKNKLLDSDNIIYDVEALLSK